MEEVEKVDFKTGETVAPEAGLAEKTAEPEEAVQAPEVKEQEPLADETKTTESIEALPDWAQDRLKKAEEERENLSKAVSRLNKERKLTLDKPKEEEAEEEYPEWDETSKKFQKQTISLAEKTAERIAQQKLEKANEKAAIDRFLKENPNVDWNGIVSNYNPTHGKETIEDISKDLERASVLARYEKGELTKSEKNKVEKDLANMASVSKTTSKTVKGTTGVSQGALKLAEKMRVNPESLAKEDDSNLATHSF